MNPTARRLDQILTDAPTAAALAARLAAARRAAQIIAPICAEIAPDFDPMRPGNCDLRERTLRIWLRSGAHSAKLRQATPRLMASLACHGLEVNEIKVGVQLGRLRATADSKSRNSGPMGAFKAESGRNSPTDYLVPLTFTDKLALTLPDSELRRAALRLGEAIRTRLARMRESDQSFDQQGREENDTHGKRS